MSVAYEPRNFMHEGAYPSMGDDHDQRFTDNDVAEQLSHYTTEADMLPDEREILGDNRGMMSGDDHDNRGLMGGEGSSMMAGDDRGMMAADDRGMMVGDDREMLSGDDRGMLQVPSHDRSMLPGDDGGMMADNRALIHHHDTTTDQDVGRLDFDNDLPSPLNALHPPQLPDTHPENQDLSPSAVSPSAQSKGFTKPEREVSKGVDGKYHCPMEDCREDFRAFTRKCEWNKHMDKHERPYRCLVFGCENLPGFTYSGGLLRHEREVHNKHGGPKNTVNCPHATCKRHTGKGFSRQENLNEHLRRVHTTGSEIPTPPAPATPEALPSEPPQPQPRKRKRSNAIEELQSEVKRLREHNESLQKELETQSQTSLAMMAQITHLQEALQARDALRHIGSGTGELGAPTAQMI